MIKLILLLLITSPVMASEYRHHKPTTIHTETIINSQPISAYKGIALSIATSQHHFDFGTHSLQGSLSSGFYNGEEALSFALGKRFDRILLNASFGIEQGELGLGIGLNWRF